MEERAQGAEDAKESIVQLHSRLTQMEDAECERLRTSAICLPGSTNNNQFSPGGAELQAIPEAMSNPTEKLALAAMEAQVTDLVQKMALVQGELHELLTKVQTQEERHKTLRTLHDQKDEQYRRFEDKMEKDNWDAHFKDLKSRFEGMEKSRIEHAEGLQLLQQKMDENVQSHEEMGNSMRRLQERGSDALALMAAGGDLDAISLMSPNAAGVGYSALDECLARLQASEDRVQTVSRELQMLRSDQQVGTHVASLVNTLKEVAPKVIEHDSILLDLKDGASKMNALKEITPRVDGHDDRLKQLQDDLGTGMNMWTSNYRATGKCMESIEARLGRLESEVHRLVDEAEGEYGEVAGVGAEDGQDDQAEVEAVIPNFQQQRRASATE